MATVFPKCSLLCQTPVTTQRNHCSTSVKGILGTFSSPKVGIVRRNKSRRICCSSAAGVVGVECDEEKYLVQEFGWRVRRMVKIGEELRKVADVQAEAFHVPVFLFNDFFFEFFKAEVLSALIYKVRSSPSDRYACLVAESTTANEANLSDSATVDIVGVVDLAVQNDKDVVRHLDGAEKYGYVSGMAVLSNFRRLKVATVLLKGCEALSLLWGCSYLALQAYEDDTAARKLYSKAGYNVVSTEPSYVKWIGRRRRVLMIKKI